MDKTCVRSYGSGYSSFDRKSTWERPSSLYSSSESSYTKPSYTSTNPYMSSRSDTPLEILIPTHSLY